MPVFVRAQCLDVLQGVCVEQMHGASLDMSLRTLLTDLKNEGICKVYQVT